MSAYVRPLLEPLVMTAVLWFAYQVAWNGIRGRF